MAVETLDSDQQRLSKVETEMAHLGGALGHLADSIDKGFKETRNLISDQDARTERKVADLHEKFETHALKQMESKRLNPNLVVGIIASVVLIGGVFVHFVNMRLDPMESVLMAHMNMDGHPEALTKSARLEQDVQWIREGASQDVESLRRERALIYETVLVKFASVESSLSSIKSAIHDHEEQADHPFGVLSQIAELRGMIQGLQGHIEDVDKYGSRKHIIGNTELWEGTH